MEVSVASYLGHGKLSPITVIKMPFIAVSLPLFQLNNYMDGFRSLRAVNNIIIICAERMHLCVDLICKNYNIIVIVEGEKIT